MRRLQFSGVLIKRHPDTVNGKDSYSISIFPAPNDRFGHPGIAEDEVRVFKDGMDEYKYDESRLFELQKNNQYQKFHDPLASAITRLLATDKYPKQKVDLSESLGQMLEALISQITLPGIDVENLKDWVRRAKFLNYALCTDSDEHSHQLVHWAQWALDPVRYATSADFAQFRKSV